MLTKLVHGSCFGYFQGLMVELLPYIDNGGHPQLICNIHQLMTQRRELLLMTEIQPPVKFQGRMGWEVGGRNEREREKETENENFSF